MKCRIVGTSAGPAKRIASVLGGGAGLGDVMARPPQRVAARYARPPRRANGTARPPRYHRAMAVIACDACGGRMNDGLAVCPHCGARRALTDRPKLSGEEIRALLATDRSTRDRAPRGLV